MVQRSTLPLAFWFSSNFGILDIATDWQRGFIERFSYHEVSEGSWGTEGSIFKALRAQIGYRGTFLIVV